MTVRPDTAVSGTARARSAVRNGLLATVVAVACAALGVAVLFGAALFEVPLLAPAAAAAVLVLPLVLVRPVVVLVLVTVAEFANLSGVAALNGLPGGESALLALAVLTVLVAVLRGQLRPAWSPLVVAGLVYLVAQALSALANQEVDTSLSPIADADTGLAAVAVTAKALLWPVVVALLALVPGHAPRAVARAIALTLAGLAGLTIVQEFLLGNATLFAGLANVPLAADVGGATARHAGPQEDANFWGRVLVLGLPFALSLAQMATTHLRRLAWLGAAVVICGGVVLTGSRGALLAVFVVGCVWALLAGGRYAKAVLLAPLVGGAMLFVPGIGSRLSTLSLLGTSDGLAVVDPSLEGRVAAQQVAVQVFADHPVLGVGPGNFLVFVPEYLRRLGIDTIPLAPHNQYLEAAAEGGLFGLLAWLLLLGVGVVVAARARLLARSGGPAVDQEAPVALSNAVLAALAGWAVASVFLHLATFRSFLFVLALGAALDIRARRSAERLRAEQPGAPSSEASPEERPARRRRARRYGAGVVIGLLVATSGALWNAGGPPGTVWSASVGMRLVSIDEGNSTSPAYDLDTMSRSGIVRTLAGILASPRFADEGLERVAGWGVYTEGTEVEVSGSVESALVVVTATGPDEVAATLTAQETRYAAAAFVNSLSPLYGVRIIPGDPVTESSEPPFDRRVALVPLAVAGAVLLALVGSGMRARRRGRPVDERAPVAAPSGVSASG